MFTDMVGYTALTQSNEQLALEVLDRHNRLLRPFFPKFHGTEVKAIGDSFLVEFESALDAIRCAVEIQSYFHDYNIPSKDEWKVKLRIGIHLGDVIHQGGDAFGDAVNIASRIEPIAEAEGICISEQVYDQVHNKSPQSLLKLAPKDLKNVQFPTDVYKVVMPWEKSQEVSPRDLDSRRIAILPFANISPDPADEYFADGMTEELITTMSKLEGLKVIARTSIIRYKGGAKSVAEIAKELEVGSVLEGSVRKANDKLRITVQLIDSRTSDHLWAESYDRELKDVFAIQSDVASRVASSLSTGFFSKVPKTETNDIEAYTLYLRAMQFYHEGTEPALREAVALFQQAVAKDPRFVRAYAGLAHAWGRIVTGGYEDFTLGIGKAEAAARRALELGPDWAEAHAAMADVHGYMDRFDKEESEAEKAIQINPNLSEAYASLGSSHSAVGDVKQALVDYRTAYELDPLSSRAGILVLQILSMSGRDAEVPDFFEKINRLNPMNTRAYGELAHHYILRKDFTKAQELLDTGLKINPAEPWLRIYQGVLYAKTGRTMNAAEVLEGLLQDRRESVRLMGQVFIQTALGNLDEAYKALTREAETHAWYSWIKLDPLFEELRKGSRFAEFCMKIGLPT